ncbi:hypothetical protein [Neobacillus soli]|uniref:hypothetical protein n=1 Tax=Neobacillus soli TaxID=220688 RepID=UPI0008255D75|nr:hypothetical protein [Neobacillus soli]
MKIDDPYFIVEPDKEGVPFISSSHNFADAILRVKINSIECDVFVLTRDGWEISEVLHPGNIDMDYEELRKALLTHPKLRLLALVGG